MLQTISVIVKGKVQGVYYRQSTKEQASALGVTGTVQNMADRSVKIIATGDKQQLDKLAAWCHKGPAGARVISVDIKEEALQLFPDFRVLR